MLVDARWPPPDPEPAPRPFPLAAIAYPALTVAFLAVGYLVPPIVGFGCAVAALYCAAESLALLVPRNGGMTDYRQ
jgi:hypothetical protein